jgi:hypothetical protein
MLAAGKPLAGPATFPALLDADRAGAPEACGDARVTTTHAKTITASHMMARNMR